MSITKYIKEPWRIIASTKLQKYMKWVPDRMYLKCLYRASLNEKLNLRDPQNYNAKLQWLKIHDHEPSHTEMVDKYAAKKYVADKIGEEYIIKTLGVWDSFEDINFDALPERFVLKCTHDSAGLAICRDKKSFDMAKAKAKLSKCLKRNFYYSGREWPYKNVKPRIIAEEYMEDTTLQELRDYKFFTFKGVPKVMHLVSNRQNQNEETFGDFFDMEFNHLDLTMGHNNAPVEPEKPRNFELMIKFAEILSNDTAHLRVDFYEVNGHLYFGELTFYQDSGFADILPTQWNDVLGSWIEI